MLKAGIKAWCTQSLFIESRYPETGPISRALSIASGHSLFRAGGSKWPVSPVQFSHGPESSGGRKWLCLHSCRWVRWLHLLSALQEAVHLLRTVARGCLILPKTLLKGLKGLCTGLADLTDDWVVRGASSDAHFEMVTVPLPGLWLGSHTLAVLVQLPAAVAGSNLQRRLPAGHAGGTCG